jgi:anti-anti-sigma factor
MPTSPPVLKVDVEDVDEAYVIRIQGELDISTTEELAEPARLALSTNCPLILDLSACTFIDSSGLRFVLRTQAALAESGRPLAVVTDSSHVRDRDRSQRSRLRHPRRGDRMG